MDRLSFSSDHVNYLILRYLQERSYSHSAYTFQHEGRINQKVFQPGEVPPGALIHIIQKGLQFIEMEANVSKEGKTALGDYKFLHSKDLFTKDIEELRQEVRSLREEMNERKDPESFPMGSMKEEMKEEVTEAEEIKPEQVTTLRGHSSEVIVCTWSPVEDLLASGSGDASARIWNLLDEETALQEPLVLKHSMESSEEVAAKSNDVTTMDWSPDGSQLATGSYDGQARIWSKNGTLLNVLKFHVGPIFSIKWNGKGTLLLSGSVDRTAIVSDVKTGDLKQTFHFHTAAALDVDWKNNHTFATCSTDHDIYVCKLGEDRPIKTFRGHDNEVNCIKWDPTGRFLASCSDDSTARIWSLNQTESVLILKDHSKEIYTVKWSPTGQGSENPNLPLVLASASFDSTVKLWDLEAGKCSHNLAKHSASVYSVAFSPNGQFLASGSFDKKVLIWSVADGTLVKSFTGKGGVFEVCWNKTGTKVAASCSNRVVSVIDMRM